MNSCRFEGCSGCSMSMSTATCIANFLALRAVPFGGNGAEDSASAGTS